MAGYAGYSKSNNALAAEAEGRYPATKLAARIRRYFPGVTAADIKAAMRSGEWHHTSCKYNTTDYFDIRDLAELATRQALRAAISERKRESSVRDRLKSEYSALYAQIKVRGVSKVALTLNGRTWQRRIESPAEAFSPKHYRIGSDALDFLRGVIAAFDSPFVDGNGMRYEIENR